MTALKIKYCSNKLVTNALELFNDSIVAKTSTGYTISYVAILENDKEQILLQS